MYIVNLFKLLEFFFYYSPFLTICLILIRIHCDRERSKKGESRREVKEKTQKKQKDKGKKENTLQKTSRGVERNGTLGSFEVDDVWPLEANGGCKSILKKNIREMQLKRIEQK